MSYTTSLSLISCDGMYRSISAEQYIYIYVYVQRTWNTSITCTRDSFGTDVMRFSYIWENEEHFSFAIFCSQLMKPFGNCHFSDSFILCVNIPFWIFLSEFRWIYFMLSLFFLSLSSLLSVIFFFWINLRCLFLYMGLKQSLK